MTNAPANSQAPCIVQGVPADVYHAHPAISKTGLWTIYTRTPSHFRYQERVEKTHFTFGNAAHCALTEADEFERRYMRGPEDRRGKKWEIAQLQASAEGRELLTDGDYDSALRLIDVALTHPILSLLQRGRSFIEQSAFWHDPETNVLCRCRPDIMEVDKRLVVDLKTTTDASPRAFAKAVYEYGYHVQEAFYTDGWGHALQGIEAPHRIPIEAWCFVALEKPTRHKGQIAVYELEPDVVEEGRAIYRRALATYSACLATDTWPGYPEEVQPLAFQPWQYRELEEKRSPLART